MVDTEISTLIDGRLLVRGYDIAELIAGASFADCVHLLLGGERPDASKRRIIDALLVSCVDHGINAPSIHIARASASCGVPLTSAVASGIAAIGTHHGGAGEACARLLQETAAGGGEMRERAREIVRHALEEQRAIPGYGHRVYRTADPRAQALLGLARECGFRGNHCRLAETIAEELERQKGKRLVLNVDGAHAAILSDIGYHWSRVQSFFVIGRAVGLCAHALEETDTGKPLSYLNSARAEVSYSGPPPRAKGEGWRAEGGEASHDE